MQVYGKLHLKSGSVDVLLSYYKISSLSDKTNNSTDNNAAKTLALDHLGVIAARLTTSSLKFRKESKSGGGALTSVDDVSINKLDHEYSVY
jgi:cohesin loading factor subunit SCC2